VENKANRHRDKFKVTTRTTWNR